MDTVKTIKPSSLMYIIDSDSDKETYDEFFSVEMNEIQRIISRDMHLVGETNSFYEALETFVIASGNYVGEAPYGNLPLLNKIAYQDDDAGVVGYKYFRVGVTDDRKTFIVVREN